MTVFVNGKPAAAVPVTGLEDWPTGENAFSVGVRQLPAHVESAARIHSHRPSV